MNVADAIKKRRSIKEFTDRPVTSEEIEALLELAVLAPNHRMTQPWAFRVLGDRARTAYAQVLGRRKTKKMDDDEAAAAVRRKVLGNTLSVPAMLAVTIREDDDPEIREEDYAATMMGVENMCLAAVEMGLGTHIKTGAVMNDPELREAWGVPEDRRVVATLHIGEPATLPDPKPRGAAAERIEWMD